MNSRPSPTRVSGRRATAYAERRFLPFQVEATELVGFMEGRLESFKICQTELKFSGVIQEGHSGDPVPSLACCRPFTPTAHNDRCLISHRWIRCGLIERGIPIELYRTRLRKSLWAKATTTAPN